MQPLIQVGDRAIEAHEIIPQLSCYGLLPRLVQEVVVDQAIAAVTLTPEETAAAESAFCDRRQLKTPEQQQAWVKQQYGSPELLQAMAVREARIEKFKAETFGDQVDSYFLQRKSRLDRVQYSLIRTREAGLAQELYFRIHDDGQPFTELAQDYSDGQESQTGGLIGPVELSVPHPNLAQLLSISQPGQLWPPQKIGDWFVIVRLERFFPAQLDDAMRQRLLDELFKQWLQEQLQSLSVQIPDVATPTPVETEADDPWS